MDECKPLIWGFTFALIVGSIGDVITRSGVAESAYLHMMGELKEFLLLKSVSPDLTTKVGRCRLTLRNPC